MNEEHAPTMWTLQPHLKRMRHAIEVADNHGAPYITLWPAFTEILNSEGISYA